MYNTILEATDNKEKAEEVLTDMTSANINAGKDPKDPIYVDALGFISVVKQLMQAQNA